MADYKKETILDIGDNQDMWNELQKEAKHAVEHIKVEYKIAKHIKEKFDEKYGPNWHCVVGKNFSSYVSHETKNYAFFYEGQLGILLYKIG
jgi:dynein light chain LC8-type